MIDGDRRGVDEFGTTGNGSAVYRGRQHRSVKTVEDVDEA